MGYDVSDSVSDQSVNNSTTISNVSPPRDLLAIDSSGEQAGVALFDGWRVAEVSWPAGRSQTTTLLGQIHRLLDLHELAATDVGAIGVAVGPGTFNGLRVGLSVAKGLALGLTIPVIGVPTLAAVALPHAPHGQMVVAVVAAGRDRVIWATYESRNDRWQESAAARNGTIEALVQHVYTLEPAPLVTGDLTPDQEAALMVAGITMPPPALRTRRPAAVADLAWQRWQNGDIDDLTTLEPIYLAR